MGSKKISQMKDGSAVIRMLPTISPYIRKKLISVLTGINREMKTCCRLKQSI